MLFSLSHSLTDLEVVVRVTESNREMEDANRLVCRNYVEEGYWENDEPFWKNEHMHLPTRTVFIVKSGDQLLATASIVRDSARGLPADKFQPDNMKRLRASGSRLAEVSALAVDKTYKQPTAVVLFLFKYIYQYSFYYAAHDILVVVPTVRHVSFYKRVCCFREQGEVGQYSYVKGDVRAQLLSLDLLQAHRTYCEQYGSAAEDNFYRFLLVAEHPSLRFPDKRYIRRPREIDWVAQARTYELREAV